MDLSTSIIGAAILALCIVPLVLAHNKKKNKQLQLLQALMAHAEMFSCKITTHDLWQNTAIGMDESANSLFFVRNTGGAALLEKAHLAGIKEVYIKGEALEGPPEKLELVLVHSASNEADTVLEFYNHDVTMQLNEEFQLAKKWEEIIRNAMHN